MNNLSLRRAFVVFHVTLGLVVFFESVETVRGVLAGHLANPMGSHLAAFAGVEALAALLFLFPKTMKVGSILLIGIFLVAIIIHGPAHELSLLVFAAGVLFVRIHGSAFSRQLLGF